MPVIERDYQISDLRKGDLVLLRWIGDRRVPNREGQSWATVDQVEGEYARVFNCTYGTTRRITTEHIFRVEKKVGRNVYEDSARRLPTPQGTRLAALDNA